MRCRLKAEAALAGRAWRGSGGADYATEIEPQGRDLITRARALPDGFLWMCHRDGPAPADSALYDTLAGCFDAAADAVAVLHGLAKGSEDPEMLAQALDLAAESQSAMRVVVAAMDGRPDEDQDRIFAWLRETGDRRHQIFIRRFMRGDDPADPAGWPGLRERIGQLDAVLERGPDEAGGSGSCSARPATTSGSSPPTPARSAATTGKGSSKRSMSW